MNAGPGGASLRLARLLCLFGLGLKLMASGPVLRAQTFSQVTELGSNIGPRLTRQVAMERLGEPLFGGIGSKITLVDALVSPPTAYEFASDRLWHRVLFGKKDDYIRSFDNGAPPRLSLESPRGLDISTQRTLFVADAFNGRVLLARFDPATRSITPYAEASGAALGGLPLDVAWDGGSKPVSDGNEFFYVIDGGGGRLSYWGYILGGLYPQWGYGSAGSGVGQFLDPEGVCVGHALGAEGEAVFTSDIYVADTGNGRLVWLRRGTSGPTWMGSVTLGQAGVPVDCTVDQFGNVYVADRRNSRLIKYTAALEWLDQYGSYGRGATNYNTFSHPRAVHVPYGLKLVGGVARYYGEGRILTAEEWTDSSGALEHWLGVGARDVVAWSGAFGASVDFRMTDHAMVAVDILRGGLMYRNVERSPRVSGWNSQFWDGTDPWGNPAPAGYYQFLLTVTSPYGCDGSAWCGGTFTSNEFYWGGGCDGGCIVPEAAVNVALPLEASVDLGVPSSFFLHQLVSSYVGPLARREAALTGVAAAGGEPAPAAPGALAAQVRAQGLLALTVGVPAGPNAVPVLIRVYSLGGALVSELARRDLEPGEYVVGWDARDRDGRSVPPGVYLAVMTAGSFRAVQRLIVARP